MAGYPPYQFGAQSGSSAQFFPQSQGGVYLINNSLEVANVPIGAGISVALCMNEGVMYIKGMQGGMPSLMTYRISPYENAPTTKEAPPAPAQEKQKPQQDLLDIITKLEERIASLEKKKEALV
ncbi:MAG TPA: hypothetical protein DCW90_12675 [Lachnospiraceae bacterium]|nr:hypothetical protein [Lachnospiraceae bacterium]